MALLILAAVIVLSIILIVLGLPGLWIMVATAVAYNLIVPGEPIGWVSLIAVAVLAFIAELTGGSSAGDATRVAKGALIGRVVSTALKIGIGFTIGIWIFIAAMK